MFAPIVPGFIHVLPSYPYRYPAQRAVEDLEAAIRREGPDSVAAFIAEPVIGAGGVIAPAPGYFPAVREICDRYELLLISDAVITGFGRTGRWFALDHWGVRPDMVTFAKGVTSAYLPLGGVMVSREIHAEILQAPAAERFMHAATYSGHPACCAVGLANLDILEREGLVQRAEAAGRRLLGGLESLRELPGVGDVRGLGLMAGIELVTDKEAKAPALGLGARVLAQARQRGLITRIRAGQGGEFPIGDVVCLAPPLIITDAQVDRIVEILRESILTA
jgi:adenosylmethionine-8-amino-7-oxononanoate aminotransferase